MNTEKQAREEIIKNKNGLGMIAREYMLDLNDLRALADHYSRLSLSAGRAALKDVEEETKEKAEYFYEEYERLYDLEKDQADD